MGELKRTVLYDVHVAAGATLVDFGGWEMPIQYPTGILTEHLYTRSKCGIFDVSHMGRLDISGKDQLAFLQYVLTSNAATLEVGAAQYCIIPNAEGGAVDDAYLFRYEPGRYFLVINAGNIDKDLAHLNALAARFDVTIRNVSAEIASIAVQGPASRDILSALADEPLPEDCKRNVLYTRKLCGREVRVSQTGYTGEPVNYELYLKSEDAEFLWNKFIEGGAKPIGLGARDTLRMEAGLPLYGHEMTDDRPIFSVPLAKFAVSFAEEKGDFLARSLLQKQSEDGTDSRIRQIALLDRGVLRAGCPVFKDGRQVGFVTSGTMIPYYVPDAQGEPTEETARRSIGAAYLENGLQKDDLVEIDVRGKRLKAAIVLRHALSNQPPYVRPVIR